MDAPLVAESFLVLLKKSGLLPVGDIDAAYERFNLTGGDLQVEYSAKDLARAFVNDGLITRFQAERLLEGRFRGFFIDRYKVLEILGAGGMATLYLAEDMQSGERVALKVLSDAYKLDAAMLARLKIENRAGNRLNHSGIMRTYGVHHTDDIFGEVWYLVMEYVEGINLEELINLHGPIPVAQACDFVWQAAAGLQHAHSAGLIHRDVKPGNLLVDRSGAVKILDFGLALLDGDEAAEEFSLAMIFGHSCLGTADYIAPEQSLDSYSVDSRADIYSLGCTLYVALSGKLPYPMASSCQKLEGHRLRPPPPLRTVAKNVPEEVIAIVEKMMAKRPEDRFQTMAEIVSALTPFARRQPVDFDFPKVLGWRAREARRRFAEQRRRAGSFAGGSFSGSSLSGGSSVAGGANPSKATRKNLQSASTRRLPEAVRDTAIGIFPKSPESVISLVSPFEGAREEASLSRPDSEMPAGSAKVPMLLPGDGANPIALVGNRIMLGRDPDCDVCIASTQVSSRHCELRRSGSAWQVVDLESKNGTQVNGVEVAERMLRHGDRLSLARSHHFSIDYPAAARVPMKSLASWAVLAAMAGALVAAGIAIWRFFA